MDHDQIEMETTKTKTEKNTSEKTKDIQYFIPFVTKHAFVCVWLYFHRSVIVCELRGMKDK